MSEITAFIRNYSLRNIKIKLFILYILNTTDIIFTLFLLSTGFFKEANILMIETVQNPLLSVLIKIILPALLLIIIYFRMRNATDRQLKKSNILINGVIILYTLINISHIVYLACYLYMV